MPEVREKTAWFGKQGFTLLVAVLVTAASYCVIACVGPVAVRVGLDPTEIVAPQWYLISVGFPFGILLAEALIDFREYKSLPMRLLPFGMLLVLALLGTIRFALIATTSGHGLIAAFFLLHEMGEPREGKNWKLLVGLAILVQAAWYKLFVWNDPSSLLIGLGLGIFAWGIERTVSLAILLRAKGKADQK
jgi:hypothetical protein